MPFTPMIPGENQRILVTGSAGFFASWLVPALEEYGFETVPYDLRDGDDILDEATLRSRMAGCKGVVHLAGIPHYKAEIPESAYFATNAGGTLNVWEAFLSERNATHFVYPSTGAIYGFGPGSRLPGWVTSEMLPIRENLVPPLGDSMGPADGDLWDRYRQGQMDPYSMSKAMAEQVLDPGRKWRAVTILRVNCIEPKWHYAPEVHWGWETSQRTAIECFIAALERQQYGREVVNIGEPNPNLDLDRMWALLGGVL